MNILNLEVRKDIAIISFDQPDSAVNVLGVASMQELSNIIDDLSQKTQDLKALIITSKKQGIFIAGADIKEIEHIDSTEEAFKKADQGKEIFKKLAELDLIKIAAVNGACLGGGLELALSCDYLVAAFSDRVKIGLPEVNLGIIPGWGGTQRLPRKIGLMRALSMILAGQIISAKDALKYGLVERLFSEVGFLESCLEFANQVIEKGLKQKKKKKKLFNVFLEKTPLGKAILFNSAKKNVLKKTKGFYPAPLEALEVIKKTWGKDIDKGFNLESEVFAQLVISQVCKNLIKVFYLNEEYKKFAWVDKEIKPAKINKCGVVGAGIMGGGIAQLLVYRDIPVRLKDINYGALGKALKTALGIFKYALSRRKIKKHQVDYKMGLISPTLTYQGFKNADIVIEAVVEDLGIKQKVFKDLGEATSAKTILASNTSSLSIEKMAQVTTLAARVVGLHFFNPVHRMPLVEVIKTKETSDETLATTIAFARKLGKVVIVVKDIAGFLINRILLSYMNEAAFLLEQGLSIEKIDKIAKSFGMPMGPIELTDEVGVDVGYKVAKILEGAYGKRMEVASILQKVKEKGLLGKKINKGFYIYKGKKKKPNSQIYKFIAPSLRGVPKEQESLKRMIYIMINEAARCLEEGVVEKPQTIDIGMIMGTGFPPHKAGLLRYADSVGVDKIVNDLEGFAEEFKALRFKPCDYLVKMAKNKENFFK